MTWFLSNCFDSEDTVYGARDGCLTGLACTSREPTNIFKSAKGMKTGVIHSVAMLGRQDFYKPAVPGIHYVDSLIFTVRLFDTLCWFTQTFCGLKWFLFSNPCLLKNESRLLLLQVSSPTKSTLPHLGRAFTDIQEMKQVTWQSNWF